MAPPPRIVRAAPMVHPGADVWFLLRSARAVADEAPIIEANVTVTWWGLMRPCGPVGHGHWWGEPRSGACRPSPIA